MTTLTREQISFHPSSTGTDADARLFEWNGSLYRGVRGDNAADYVRLLESPAFAELVDRGLVVATERTSLALDEFPLVVAHDRLPFVSYPFEWSWPMLRDAALATSDLNLELVSAGFVVKDPSSWNVLFADTQPVWVDFTNIWSLQRAAYTIQQWPEWFRSFYTFPLQLVGEGNARIVRRLLRDYELGILREDAVEIGLHLRERLAFTARRGARSIRRRLHARAPALASVLPSRDMGPRPVVPAERWTAMLLGLRDEVEAIDVPVPETKWSRYYDKSLSANAPVDGLTPKHRNVAAVLDELQPTTVVDIGASTGWYSKLATEKGARVVVLEADESAVARLYFDARDNRLPILPLVMDITKPSPAYGLLGSRVAAATDRIAGDLVLALALVHHLVLGNGLDLDAVAGSLAQFARRWLLVEWIDRADETMVDYYRAVPEWYTFETFTRALEREFVVRRVLDSHPESRKLVLCERREA